MEFPSSLDPLDHPAGPARPEGKRDIFFPLPHLPLERAAAFRPTLSCLPGTDMASLRLQLGQQLHGCGDFRPDGPPGIRNAVRMGISLKASAAVVLLVGASWVFAGPARVWRYTDGRTFTAEYQWSDQKTLYLKDRKGREFQVKLGALSNADLEYTRGLGDRDAAGGIIYHAPLTWEEYRSKKVTTSKARELGYYPINSEPSTEGTLRLQFRRFGPPPSISADQRVVLRVTTHARGGTRSTIRVQSGGKTIGAARGAPAGSRFDIPLPPTVLEGSSSIVFDLTGGSDTMLVRTTESGAGPRLLVLKPKQNNP